MLFKITNEVEFKSDPNTVKPFFQFNFKALLFSSSFKNEVCSIQHFGQMEVRIDDIPFRQVVVNPKREIDHPGQKIIKFLYAIKSL